MQERRSRARMLCADMVDAQWEHEGRRRRSTALLEDISATGACLQLDHPVPLGVEMAMQCGKRELCGVVRYCVYREIGYFVGVEFENGSRWSERQFKPQHLLDLEKLLRGLPGARRA